MVMLKLSGQEQGGEGRLGEFKAIARGHVEMTKQRARCGRSEEDWKLLHDFFSLYCYLISLVVFVDMCTN